VDEVHESPVLARFWREGTLVANTAHEHPYKHSVPEELAAMPRWFLLDSDANAPWPWGVNMSVNVWSFAYLIGEEPIHRPLGVPQLPQGPCAHEEGGEQDDREAGHVLGTNRHGSLWAGRHANPELWCPQAHGATVVGKRTVEAARLVARREAGERVVLDPLAAGILLMKGRTEHE